MYKICYLFVFSLLVNLLRKIAYPFSILYGIITSIRNFLYDVEILKATKFKTPTIVVGNLSVGGTGKTPQIEYLIRLLQNDYKIAILSRGYKRKSKGFIIADKTSSAESIGDEPFQYYKKFKDIIVCVDSNRANAIQQLEALKDAPEVILLDDAFQHRNVKAGFTILLTSYNNIYVDDIMLPTGNLREYPSGAKRANLIIVTKCPSNLNEVEQNKIIAKLKPLSHQSVFFTTISYDNELKGDSKIDLEDLKNKKNILVTGIANPQPLIDFLNDKGLIFKHLKYSDHHNFTLKEIKEIKNAYQAISTNKGTLLTTEKDYVRIFTKIKKLHYISIKTSFINHENDFKTSITSYVEQSTRNR
ncbi:tetraacyldisaccharide 4'-kinase [Lutibacter aestuarii]|uniref:Tetraacyldisaccharide 4'-kinase n=1 Tax=Lutibacter aestuarii TaxID=861111 RepID=A0ABW2Z8U2_9FLAO